MLARKIKSLNDSYEKHIMQVRVDGNKAALAVLSDVHEGLNNRRQLQEAVDMLLHLGPNCKVILGGDSTNTTTRNSKGNVLEEWASGDEQVYAIVDDLKPLYESGQLIGITAGNHGARAYNDAFINVEMMIASLLGDRSLYKGEFGVVYFNVNKNCYVHHILHKHKKAKNHYDYFNADVTWYEHFHEPYAVPKLVIEHNKYVKKPVAKEIWELHQGSFQVYPDYCKASGIRPTIGGFYIAEMSGNEHQRQVIPYLDHQLHSLIERGYTL